MLTVTRVTVDRQVAQCVSRQVNSWAVGEFTTPNRMLTRLCDLGLLWIAKVAPFAGKPSWYITFRFIDINNSIFVWPIELTEQLSARDAKLCRQWLSSIGRAVHSRSSIFAICTNCYAARAICNNLPVSWIDKMQVQYLFSSWSVLRGGG